MFHLIEPQTPVKIARPARHPYSSKVIVLTTKHKKYRVLSKPLQSELGAIVLTVEADTDQLGTFTGEIERVETARLTALQKARMGLGSNGWKVGVATEASFSPDPSSPVHTLHAEWIAFVDENCGLQLTESMQTRITNFGSSVVQPGQDISRFLEAVSFGSHALIVRANAPKSEGDVFRGVTAYDELSKFIRAAAQQSSDGQARLETDMRADQNPTRMEVIGLLGLRLARRLRSQCAKCLAPGWGLVEVKRGLPCESCLAPTPLANVEVHGCALCSHQEEKPRLDGLKFAPAGKCDCCNP